MAATQIDIGARAVPQNIPVTSMPNNTPGPTGGGGAAGLPPMFAAVPFIGGLAPGAGRPFVPPGFTPPLLPPNAGLNPGEGGINFNYGPPEPGLPNGRPIGGGAGGSTMVPEPSMRVPIDPWPQMLPNPEPEGSPTIRLPQPAPRPYNYNQPQPFTRPPGPTPVIPQPAGPPTTGLPENFNPFAGEGPGGFLFVPSPWILFGLLPELFRPPELYERPYGSLPEDFYNYLLPPGSLIGPPVSPYGPGGALDPNSRNPFGNIQRPVNPYRRP
jgi:hypothetical protein